MSQLQVDQHDTLGRWMAYRLAELLAEADENAEARESATSLTLRLWNHRSDWPNGWPPEGAKEQIPWLFKSERSPRWQEHAAPVDRFMDRIADNLTEEYRFWIRAVGAAVEAEKDDDSLSLWESGQDSDAIRRLRRIMAEAAGETSDDEPNKTPEEQMTHRLEVMLQHRRGLLEEALVLASKLPHSE